MRIYDAVEPGQRVRLRPFARIVGYVLDPMARVYLRSIEEFVVLSVGPFRDIERERIENGFNKKFIVRLQTVELAGWANYDKDGQSRFDSSSLEIGFTDVEDNEVPSDSAEDTAEQDEGGEA